MNSLSTPVSSAPVMRRHHRPSVVTIALCCIISIGALASVVYLLWPTWHATASNDPTRLPITVGSALFNVPSKAIRMRLQRRSGPQERIDLAFEYPSLLPPTPQAHVTADTVEAAPIAANRIFMSIAAEGDVITPQERARTIYPRYAETEGTTQDGLTGRAFRETSPYRGEDLFVATTPYFVVRCTRDAMTPGMCLSERRVDGAYVTYRFPRSWLSDWRGVAGAMDKLIEQMQRRAS